MKKIITITMLLLTLTACTAPWVHTNKSSGTDPQVGMANPASVFCEENGNTHEIQTAEDGSQTGICIFPDGSTCDEWAYFRGECGPEGSGGGTGGGEGDGSGGYMPPGTIRRNIRLVGRHQEYGARRAV